MTRHGNTCPVMCSQCLGAPVRKIDQAADVITVDGEPVRVIATPNDEFVRYGRRGGKANATRR